MNTMNYNDVFELSFEQSTICNALVDLDGRIIRANEAYLQMVGYTSDEVVNEHITKFAPEEEAEKERHILLDLLVITSYSIHYTKLYDIHTANGQRHKAYLLLQILFFSNTSILYPSSI